MFQGLILRYLDVYVQGVRSLNYLRMCVQMFESEGGGYLNSWYTLSELFEGLFLVVWYLVLGD